MGTFGVALGTNKKTVVGYSVEKNRIKILEIPIVAHRYK